ncbi:hypothetical protein [Halarchaeum sp. P4]|uniref:hypothetical protein n=1 Tax=Halarchaeum sp. P4 TaxID=3421639 RepID=UPI003EBDAF5E
MVSDLVVVPVLAATLGVVLLYTGWKRRRIHGQLSDVDPTPIRELATPGVVEVEGTATPRDHPFVAPITGRDAVLAAWKVEEWDERGDTSTWREVARGIEAPAFDVEDETGTLAVEAVSKRNTAGKWTQTTGVSAADGVRIEDVLAEFEAFPVEAEFDPDEELPDGIRRLHEDHGLYEDTGSITNAVDVGAKHGRRRYSEQVVAPGDDVYLHGRIEASDGASERFRPDEAHLTEPADGLLVVSDQDEASLEAEFAGSARVRIVAGVVATVAGVAGVAYMLGLL